MALYLTDAGPDRFATLAAVRRVFGLSIGQASALVANLPACLPDNGNAPEPDAVVAALEAVGATVSRQAPSTATRPHVVPRPTPTPAPEPVYAPDPEPPAQPVQVHLAHVGRSKLAVVKAVCDGAGIRLAAAKNLVDKAPANITMSTRDRAEWLVMRLGELGAVAYIDE